MGTAGMDYVAWRGGACYGQFELGCRNDRQCSVGWCKQREGPCAVELVCETSKLDGIDEVGKVVSL